MTILLRKLSSHNIVFLYPKQWSTSRVVSMHLIFAQTEQFDQNLSNWDTFLVRDTR